jgi:hypothetical protein
VTSASFNLSGVPIVGVPIVGVPVVEAHVVEAPGITLTYHAANAANPAPGEFFTPSGDVGLNIGGVTDTRGTNTLAVAFNPTVRQDGIVASAGGIITDGALINLAMSVSDSFAVDGVTFTPPELNLDYDAASGEFDEWHLILAKSF